MNHFKRTMMGLVMGAVALSAQAADKVELEGAKVGVWTMDYDAAVKLAGEKKLPLMLNFTGSDWCGWCKKLDRETFGNAEVIKLVETFFIPVRISLNGILISSP